MLEVAIVGGGLCGLALARRLQAAGIPWALYEARPRLGGRVLSVRADDSGQRVDLGATWYWPQTEPRVTRLIGELALADFPQHDEGVVLVLKDPDKNAEETTSQIVHQGARRLVGGMTSLVEALATSLPVGRIHLAHTLKRVQRHSGHIELLLAHDQETVAVAARHTVLAFPPRLVREQVRFEPALEARVLEALEATPTWMATRAKAVVTYAQPCWRVQGLSGNAFVQHEQATMSEIFDACDADGKLAALGGFLALAPDLRQRFKVGLPMLLGSQMTQIFGADLHETGQLYQDWAEEPATCSARDLSQDAPQPLNATPLLREPLWNGQLLFGASETAIHGAGHMEGALEVAHGIGEALVATARVAPAQTDRDVVQGAGLAAAASAAPSPNAACLARFRAWVASRQEPAFVDYRRRINQSLAVQQREQLTQRAMLGAMEEVFGDALAQLQSLPFDTTDMPVERNRSALTPEVQAAFQGFMQTLLDDVTAFNRTSCALSSFPYEHELPGEYLQTILRDIAAAWKEFSIGANSILLEKIPQRPPAYIADKMLPAGRSWTKMAENAGRPLAGDADDPQVGLGRSAAFADDVTTTLLARAEEAATAVLTLTEGLEREELLRSRLTRREVRRQLLIIGHTLEEVSKEARRRAQEIDWEAWRTTASRIVADAVAADDALWFAVAALVPATLIWLRIHRH
jgi:monoamine oxidase